MNSFIATSAKFAACAAVLIIPSFIIADLCGVIENRMHDYLDAQWCAKVAQVAPNRLCSQRVRY